MGNWKKYNYVSLQTKVSAANNERFQECARRAGLKSGYELLQVIVAAFLRVADAEHEPIDEEVQECENINRWTKIFENWIELSKSLNTSRKSRSQQLRIDEAILLFNQPGHKAYSLRRVIMRGDEPMTIGREVDSTIDAMIRKLKPKTYQELLELGRACGTRATMETVQALIDDTNIPRIKDDGQGQLPGLTSDVYGNGFVRHNNKERKE